MDVDANPTRFDAVFPFEDEFSEFGGCGGVDAQKEMAVGAGAAAARPGLNTEQVVKKFGDEPGMKDSVRMTDVE